MQAELERDLLIRPSPVDQGDGGLERFEVQKVEGVLQCIEESGDRGAVDVGLAVSLGLKFRTRPIDLDSVKSADAENQLVDTQPDIDRATLVEFFAQPLERLLLLP